MKDFLVKAKIRTDRFSNTGIIRINDNIIEGIFTWDYVKIFLDGNQLSLIFREYQFEYNPFFDMFFSNVEQTIYETEYHDFQLESPSKYNLYDQSGEKLELTLIEPIKDPKKISHLLDVIEEFKI